MSYVVVSTCLTRSCTVWPLPLYPVMAWAMSFLPCSLCSSHIDLISVPYSCHAPPTMRPLNLLFCPPGTLFLRDIYSCFFTSFGSPLKHLLIVKPSLNNGRKTAQGSATSPLLPISLILLHFRSLFFLITSWHILWWFFIVCLCFIRSSVLFACFPSN